LQGRASEILAEVTGAEAGYVTSGASAALMLASAACLAGFDLAKMNRLPDATVMTNEVVVACSLRNLYDRAVAQAGARLVEVGIPDRFSGAGVRDWGAQRSENLRRSLTVSHVERLGPPRWRRRQHKLTFTQTTQWGRSNVR
jgi:hypothetical protein